MSTVMQVLIVLAIVFGLPALTFGVVLWQIARGTQTIEQHGIAHIAPSRTTRKRGNAA